MSSPIKTKAMQSAKNVHWSISREMSRNMAMKTAVMAKLKITATISRMGALGSE